MVLTRLRPNPAPPATRGSRGVTLIEMLIAVSLSAVVIGMALALFRDAGFAARLGQNRRDAVFQAQALFNSLSGNLMTGRGILRLVPGGRVEVLNARNLRVDYQWGDSLLTANGRAMNFRLASLRVEPEGPTRPAWKGFAATAVWDLDSLDGNRDGSIDFEELDRDRNGELDAEESRFIARIIITMTTINRGIPITQTCTVHPRNRVPATVGEDARDVMESAGVPEP